MIHVGTDLSRTVGTDISRTVLIIQTNAQVNHYGGCAHTSFIGMLTFIIHMDVHINHAGGRFRHFFTGMLSPVAQRLEHVILLMNHVY
jgi:hypothetical protein